MKETDCLFVAYAGQQRLLTDLQTFSEKKIVQPQPIFNAAIAYLCTYIYKKGFTFEYISSFEHEKEELCNKLQGDILVVAISTTFCNSIQTIREMVRFVRQYNKTAKIVVGGSFMAAQISPIHPQAHRIMLCREIGADFYINSFHGEESLAQLIGKLKHAEDPSSIQNLVYRKEGKFLFSSQTVEKCDLEHNPVDWRLFEKNITSIVPVRTAVSCMYNCSYCSFHIRAGKYQNTSVETIEKELNLINELKQVKMVNFIDDSFNMPNSRFKEILRMMNRNKYNFAWHSYFRCQSIDEETVALMKDSRCAGVIIGFESGSPQMLANMNKKINISDYKTGHSLLKKYGIPTMAMLIIGFPGETKESVQETIDFIEEIKPDFYHPHLWFCEEIAPVWQQREKYGLVTTSNSWRHNTMDSQTAQEQIHYLVREIKSSVYMSVYYTDIFSLLLQGIGILEIKEILNRKNEQSLKSGRMPT